jgi:Holliday junction resolvase RusA-like endonuclease
MDVGILHRSHIGFNSNPGGVLLVVLTLKFLGQPVGKGRPVAGRAGGFGYAVIRTPAKTRNAEADLRMQAISQLPSGHIPIKGPLAMHVIFIMQRPKHLKKSIVHPASKPDIDNTCKLLMDALNTIVYENDSQIVYLTAIKRYGPPGILMTITDNIPNCILLADADEVKISNSQEPAG